MKHHNIRTVLHVTIILHISTYSTVSYMCTIITYQYISDWFTIIQAALHTVYYVYDIIIIDIAWVFNNKA
jgi:hypothetical protein